MSKRDAIESPISSGAVFRRRPRCFDREPEGGHSAGVVALESMHAVCQVHAGDATRDRATGVRWPPSRRATHDAGKDVQVGSGVGVIAAIERPSACAKTANGMENEVPGRRGVAERGELPFVGMPAGGRPTSGVRGIMSSPWTFRAVAWSLLTSSAHRRCLPGAAAAVFWPSVASYGW